MGFFYVLHIYIMLNLITQSPVQPITLLEVKQHLIIEHNEDDARIQALLLAAVAYIADQTNRSFSANTWELTLPYFSTRIYIPLPPLGEITYIKYYDNDNVLQTLSDSNYYLVKSGKLQSFIESVDNFPATKYRPDAVVIRFLGATTATNELYKLAVKILVSHWNENREGQEVPKGFDAILNTLTSWQGVW